MNKSQTNLNISNNCNNVNINNISLGNNLTKPSSDYVQIYSRSLKNTQNAK